MSKALRITFYKGWMTGRKTRRPLVVHVVPLEGLDENPHLCADMPFVEPDAYQIEIIDYLPDSLPEG